MDNRDRSKDLDKDSSSNFNQGSSWDGEPSRKGSDGMQSDKGRSGNLEGDPDSDRGSQTGSKLDH